MKLAAEQITQRNEANRAAALRLLGSAEGEKLIAYLETLWCRRGSAAVSNHGEAAAALALHQAIGDLKRLREEAS